MTPKEKAAQLTDRFYFALPNNGSFTGPCNVDQRWEEAKLCAKIAVDEVFEFMKTDDEYTQTASNANSKWVQYFLEVQQEIEKL